jgi:predicted anti-sigma-YlaC factor YlaD
MTMNKTHYSEADLLETYYMQPGASMPVMMHLADCSDCAARYERLEAKLRGMAACHDEEQPATFWSRQRLSIMRRVAVNQRPLRTWHIAAAVVLAFLLGSFVTRETIRPTKPVTTTQQQATTTAAASTPDVVVIEDETLPADPWESDELKEFESMVAWESWVEPQTSSGDRS